jgi:probable phosphoglycerate mutase
MRAVETAQIIGAEHDGVPYTKRSDLRECVLPSPVFANVPPEHLQAGEAQAAGVFSRYLRPTPSGDENEIIVSHGNLIRYLASRVLHGAPDSWLQMKTFNCGITEIAIESDGRLWLVTYNDVGHLPAEFVTEGIPSRPKVQTHGA